MSETVDPVESVFALFNHAGDRSYGERVTMLEHSLQTAEFARQDGATDSIIVAALLHDIGHLVAGADEDIANQGIDTMHEEAGAAYLSKWFRPEVVEPGRLHVAAKRYLCATDPAYLEGLSAASLLTLDLQGGPFTKAECEGFESQHYWKDAIILRHYDDMSKVPGMQVPGLLTYKLLLRRFTLDY